MESTIGSMSEAGSIGSMSVASTSEAGSIGSMSVASTSDARSIGSMSVATIDDAKVIATEVKTTLLGYKVINGRLIRFTVEQAYNDNRKPQLSDARSSEAIKAASAVMRSQRGSRHITLMETGKIYSNGTQVEESDEKIEHNCDANYPLTASKASRLATSVLLEETLSDINLDDEDTGSVCTMDVEPIYQSDFESTFMRTHMLPPPPVATTPSFNYAAPPRSIYSDDSRSEASENSYEEAVAMTPAPGSGTPRSSTGSVYSSKSGVSERSNKAESADPEPKKPSGPAKRAPISTVSSMSKASSHRSAEERDRDIASVRMPPKFAPTRPYKDEDEDRIEKELTHLARTGDMDSEDHLRAIHENDFYKEAALRQNLNGDFNKDTVQIVVGTYTD